MRKRKLTLISGLILTLSSTLFMFLTLIITVVGIILLTGFDDFSENSAFAALGALMGAFVGIIATALGIMFFLLALLSLLFAIRIIAYSKLEEVAFRHKRGKGLFFTVWFILLSAGFILLSYATELRNGVMAPSGNFKMFLTLGIFTGLGTVLFLISLIKYRSRD